MVNSKAKGGEFERVICKRLSHWVTAGAKEDVFWRSAMSGGRSTVATKQGKLVRQAGDICAVAPEGHGLCNDLIIECKDLRRCSLEAAMFGKGDLLRFWDKLLDQAHEHRKFPVIILRQSRKPIVWISSLTTINQLGIRTKAHMIYHRRAPMYIVPLDVVLKLEPPKAWRGVYTYNSSTKPLI